MAETSIADRLGAVTDRFDNLAIAVSGGVDSMTLATFVHRRGRTAVTVVHAVSPAVPADATQRVRAFIAAESWQAIVTDAGEFDDPSYRDNPVNRCYFCKTNLYDRIGHLTPHVMASGANLDDLGDYRPGLLAAAEHSVVHPFIEAGMTKAEVRELARWLGLTDVAELAAQPCLASRVETGIAIDARDLAFVERCERLLAALVPHGATLRCRITHAGVILEIGAAAMARQAELEASIIALCAEDGRRFAATRPYHRGSMFVGA